MPFTKVCHPLKLFTFFSQFLIIERNYFPHGETLYSNVCFFYNDNSKKYNFRSQNTKDSKNDMKF